MEINESLFQEMSANYMEVHDMPPLTANIFTYLMFDFEEEGLTFEDIQEAMQASKSSISNSLNRLLQTSHIEFINKMGDRKRYYRINKEIFMIEFRQHILQLKRNRDIMERYSQFRSEFKPNDFAAQKMALHKKLMDDSIDLYENMLNQLSDLNQQKLRNQA